MIEEWKSINKIMVDVAIAETTARRYLSTFSEFFVVKQFNKVKKYREDSGAILRRIADLYEEKKSTSEIRAILKAEGYPRKSTGHSSASSSSSSRRSVKDEVKRVEAELHHTPAPMNGVDIETLSQQNLVIMATLQELAAGIKMINNQREEIALLKREITELRLQLVSIAANTGSGYTGRRNSSPSVVVGDDIAQDANETSEHIDEVVPNEPVVLPSTVDRQQLADIIAELRANEPATPAKVTPPPAPPQAPPTAPPQAPPTEPSVSPEPPTVTPIIHTFPTETAAPPDTVEPSDIPDVFQTFNVNDSEASILLDKSYTPPTSPEDTSNLSRVNSRGVSRNGQENKKWWQFWK